MYFNEARLLVLSIKISKFRICSCSFDRSSGVLEKRTFYRKIVYCIVLSY